MPTYLRDKILPVDPFQSIDVNGVGQLIDIGIKKGRASRKAKTGQHLKVGICGEHGGDPDSVHFCHKVGMDYVSCSPFRVPSRARADGGRRQLGEAAGAQVGGGRAGRGHDGWPRAPTHSKGGAITGRLLVACNGLSNGPTALRQPEMSVAPV